MKKSFEETVAVVRGSKKHKDLKKKGAYDFFETTPF
jgi:hypothetical protein